VNSQLFLLTRNLINRQHGRHQ